MRKHPRRQQGDHYAFDRVADSKRLKKNARECAMATEGMDPLVKLAHAESEIKNRPVCEMLCTYTNNNTPQVLRLRAACPPCVPDPAGVQETTAPTMDGTSGLPTNSLSVPPL